MGEGRPRKGFGEWAAQSLRRGSVPPGSSPPPNPANSFHSIKHSRGTGITAPTAA